jgi:hypothetical protein
MSQTRLYQLLYSVIPYAEQSASKFSPIMTRSKSVALRGWNPSQIPTRAPEGRQMVQYKNEMIQVENNLPGFVDLIIDDDSGNLETSDQSTSAIAFQTPKTNEILFPVTEDEQIVNKALLLFLTEITLYFKLNVK